MKKISLFNKALSVAVVAIMACATAISFAYWKSGIEGNSRNNDLEITIGTGKSYTTSVDLSQIEKSTGVLVPQYRAAQTGETNEITFTMKVTWVSVEQSTSAFEATEGDLSISVDAIMAGAQNLIDVKGYNYLSLFEFDVIYPAKILGAQTVDVTFKIRMNEPANRQQYDLIAGQRLTISLSFSVVSPDDLNQPQS